jgi:cytochrome c oxidase assembly protein subunit 11
MTAMHTAPHSSANRALLIKLAVIAALMFGFAWALIPMYRVICEVTGINQVVKADSAEGLGTPQPFGVELTFDANVQPGLPWEVRPLTPHLSGKTGEFIKVEYLITNRSNRRVVGQAIPRYLPAAAAEYVKKIDCFCFRQQTFAPGETKRLPVVFVIDPKMPREIRDITLAYTLFDVPGKGA